MKIWPQEINYWWVYVWTTVEFRVIKITTKTKLPAEFSDSADDTYSSTNYNSYQCLQQLGLIFDIILCTVIDTITTNLISMII